MTEIDVHLELNDLCYTQVAPDAMNLLPDRSEMFYTVITTFVQTLLNVFIYLFIFT